MVLHYSREFLLVTTCLLTYHLATSETELSYATELVKTIPQGTLFGKTLNSYNNRTINAFLGIPYAEPPIGNLRFANPVAAGSWNGTLNATVEPSMCPQISFDTGVFVGDEDCLYLDVYTPQGKNASLLPVMVYIHGGGFHGEYPGTSGPEYLLDADIVLLTLRYRLGPLGFLSTGDEVAPGNFGLKDQVLALKWVQSNIRYFGGNSSQVTVVGESAGSVSVRLLKLLNATTGLFNKSIGQSGSAFALWGYRPSSAYSKRAYELGEYVGCDNDTSESLISCLRTVNFSDMINTAATQFLEWDILPYIVWGPTDEPDIEGAVMTDSPANLIAAGEAHDLPSITGTLHDEGLLFITKLYSNETLLYEFLQNMDTLMPLLLYWTYAPESAQAAWVNAAKEYYLPNYLTADKNETIRNLTMLVGDVWFAYPAHLELQYQKEHTVSPQYFYAFDYRGTFSFTYSLTGTTDDLGVCHADDLIYLFPKQSKFVALNKTMSTTDISMKDAMVELWTSFVINGTPTALALGNTTWEPYSAEKDTYLRIGKHSDMSFEVQDSFIPERMEFWDKVYASTPYGANQTV